MRPTGASGEGSRKRNRKPERIAGQREHVSELSAAENADGHDGFLLWRDAEKWRVFFEVSA